MAAPATFNEELRAPSAPLVVDVRHPPEREAGKIAGSMRIPLNVLDVRRDELPRDRRLVIYCAGGYRSAMAASLLRLRGFADVTDLAGGYSAWQADVSTA